MKKGNTMTLPTAPQRNFMNLVHRNASTDPTLMVIDNEKIENQMRERRAAHEKANPPNVVPIREELKELQKQFFALTQNAQSLEQKITNLTDNIHHLEVRLTEVLAIKKHYEENCNLIAARGYEQQACRLEDELADLREQLVKEQRYSAAAGRELRAFNTDHGPRLKELQKEVG
jgi:predicted  nucleic acid-binding Zn-ribbon protein